MLSILFWLAVGYVAGGLTPITFNRLRRGALNGWNKIFGKLPEGAKDPTRP